MLTFRGARSSEVQRSTRLPRYTNRRRKWYTLGAASMIPLICRRRSRDKFNKPGRAIGSTDATFTIDPVRTSNSTSEILKPRLLRPSYTGACRGGDLSSITVSTCTKPTTSRYSAAASVSAKKNVRITNPTERSWRKENGLQIYRYHGEEPAGSFRRLCRPHRKGAAPETRYVFLVRERI